MTRRAFETVREESLISSDIQYRPRRNALVQHKPSLCMDTLLTQNWTETPIQEPVKDELLMELLKKMSLPVKKESLDNISQTGKQLLWSSLQKMNRQPEIQSEWLIKSGSELAKTISSCNVSKMCRCLMDFKTFYRRQSLIFQKAFVENGGALAISNTVQKIMKEEKKSIHDWKQMDILIQSLLTIFYCHLNDQRKHTTLLIGPIQTILYSVIWHHLDSKSFMKQQHIYPSIFEQSCRVIPLKLRISMVDWMHQFLSGITREQWDIMSQIFAKELNQKSILAWWMKEFEICVEECYRDWCGASQMASDVFSILLEDTYRWQKVVTAPILSIPDEEIYDYLMAHLKFLTHLLQQGKKVALEELKKHRLIPILKRVKECKFPAVKYLYSHLWGTVIPEIEQNE